HVERTARQGMPPVTAVDKSNAVAFVTHEPGTAAAGRVQVLDLQPPIYAPLHALWHQHTSSHNRDMLPSAPASGPASRIRHSGRKESPLVRICPPVERDPTATTSKYPTLIRDTSVPCSPSFSTASLCG